MSDNHDHPREPGMVLGSRCNVCDRPLIVAGCPLCVSCCAREPKEAPDALTSRGRVPSPEDDEEMEGCGYSYDHTTDEDTVDGLTVWMCRECGAEGFEEAEDA